MNNAKMWLVVPPSVGVPIFLGAVAVGSFAVHVAVLSNTSWVSDFLSGVPLGTGDMQEAKATVLPEADLDAAKATFVVPNGDGTQQVLVIMPDGSTTTAVLKLQDASSPAAVSPPLIAQH